MQWRAKNKKINNNNTFNYIYSIGISKPSNLVFSTIELDFVVHSSETNKKKIIGNLIESNENKKRKKKKRKKKKKQSKMPQRIALEFDYIESNAHAQAHTNVATTAAKKKTFIKYVSIAAFSAF